MIARQLLPALVLALPSVVGAQVPRGNYVGAEAPLVRVWIPGALHFRFGAPVPVSFEVSEAAHVAVFRIDGRGHLIVLWPQRNELQTAVRPGREYRIPGPRFSYAAFQADYEFGQGMVIALASPDPIDLSGLRRFRNVDGYYSHISSQRPYIGGVRNVVERITQEVLYALDSPYDYDVAFYSAAGTSHFGTAACDAYYDGYRRPRYAAYLISNSLGAWDDCFASRLYGYYAYCAVWSAFYYGSYGFPYCRLSNPFWPGVNTPGPGTPSPQPQQPYITMIDSVIARPVATTEQPSGTTHIVRMDATETPNVTRWLADDVDEPISLPSRFRKDQGAPSRTGTGISTRDEGFPRRPNSGLRVGDQPSERSPGSVLMPPVREPPRPVAWRDDDRIRTRDDGSSYSTPQRWERPRSTETTRNPGSNEGADRGHTSTGSSSPTPAVMPPRTDATVTKSDGGKTSDAKGSSERKP